MEVKINVQNVHLAEITETSGEITFGKPERVAGAMEMGRTPQLSTGQLYGDGKITHKNSKKVALLYIYRGGMSFYLSIAK